MQKNVGAFWNQLIFYEIKLLFNELYAVITTCKLELHDSGLEITILSQNKVIY